MLVKKFGGTSVGSVERIIKVAKLVKESVDLKEKVCVVVSAMSGETDRLVNLYKQISPHIQSLEYDLLLASGEQASASLLSAALNRLGVRATPLLGFQAGFETDPQRSRAKILNIDPSAVLKLVKDGVVPVVTGFQGADVDGKITTLGRGGSDTSAVALAAAVRARVCEIYTDVSGVFTADPRICAHARHIPHLSFEEMMELASLGAKVLHPRSVEIAAKFQIPIQVLNTFQKGEGTMIGPKKDDFESPQVSALTADHNMILVTLKGLKSSVHLLSEVFGPLSEKGIVVDIISHSAPNDDQHLDVSFSTPKEDTSVLETLLKSKGYRFEIRAELSKIAIVGSGMRSHSGVATQIFRTLASSEIPVLCTSTSEISVTCVIPSGKVPQAIATLHKAFSLEN